MRAVRRDRDSSRDSGSARDAKGLSVGLPAARRSIIRSTHLLDGTPIDTARWERIAHTLGTRWQADGIDERAVAKTIATCSTQIRLLTLQRNHDRATETELANAKARRTVAILRNTLTSLRAIDAAPATAQAVERLAAAAGVLEFAPTPGDVLAEKRRLRRKTLRPFALPSIVKRELCGELERAVYGSVYRQLQRTRAKASPNASAHSLGTKAARYVVLFLNINGPALYRVSEDELSAMIAGDSVSAATRKLVEQVRRNCTATNPIRKRRT